jgi:glycerol-3-phosphate dehydrogenase subunit C
MSESKSGAFGEGGLEAPTRHAIDWQGDDYYSRDSLNTELERVFDICHGCRRCVSLCDAFPTLFDLIDESDTLEVDGVDSADYGKVAEQCYLCDMCYMTKCPYVPPHEWAVDFPHLMLRDKAVEFKEKGASFRDRVLTSTDAVNKLTTIPLVDITTNTLNSNGVFRQVLEKTLGVDRRAPLPRYHSNTLKRREKSATAVPPVASPLATLADRNTRSTTGKVALFSSCYGNCNQPDIGEDLLKVFRHNHIQIELVQGEHCCGMPKMELGDLQSVAALKEHNIPLLRQYLDQGYDLIAPIPSCVLMFKQELPLLFQADLDLPRVQAGFFDPFEYLWLRHRVGLLNLDFKQPLGDISYHVACHLRVQNIGLKTRDVLNLIPATRVDAIERCSGHDGTYAVKTESRDKSVKIARPVVRKVEQAQADYFSSDCPMAATHIEGLAESSAQTQHPLTLLRMAYGL